MYFLSFKSIRLRNKFHCELDPDKILVTLSETTLPTSGLVVPIYIGQAFVRCASPQLVVACTGSCMSVTVYTESVFIIDLEVMSLFLSLRPRKPQCLYVLCSVVKPSTHRSTATSYTGVSLAVIYFSTLREGLLLSVMFPQVCPGPQDRSP